MKKLNEIESGQKEKRNFTISIPFDKGALIKLKKEAAKNGISVTLKPNPSVFQKLRLDKDRVDIDETAGIYKLKYIKKIMKRDVTQAKQNVKLKKELDIRFNKNNIAIAQLHQKMNIKTDFENLQKIPYILKCKPIRLYAKYMIFLQKFV